MEVGKRTALVAPRPFNPIVLTLNGINGMKPSLCHDNQASPNLPLSDLRVRNSNVKV